LSACSGLQRHKETQPNAGETQNAKVEENVDAEEPILREPEKFAVILGPGYLKSFAHLGVLKELEKAGLEPSAIVGFGWSSIVAGAYAINARVSEPEWSMFKLEEDFLAGKSLFGGELKAVETKNLKPYLNQVFKQKRVSQAKVNFYCPSAHLRTFDTKIEKSGYFKNEVIKCIAGNGFYKAERFHVWDPFSLEAIIEELRKESIKKILIVDIVSPKDYGKQSMKWPSVMDYYIWGKSDKIMESYGYKVDYYIPVNLSQYDWQDRDKLREFVRQGQLSSKITVEKMAREILGR
jgi:NTE family protein